MVRIRSILIVCLFGLFAWGQAAQAQTTVLVLGDSLSAAYRLKSEQGWVSLLQERIAEQGIDAQIINASISGETTQGGLTRLPDLLKRHQPDWIVLELGANDGLRATPIRLIERNLRALIDQSLAQKAKPIMVGVHLPPNYGPRYTDQFFSLFGDLASEYDAPHVPFLLEGVALNPDLMQSDGLHPTAEAQPMILDTVWPVIERALNGEG
jgi:acyl-CoA thioesterase-1